MQLGQVISNRDLEGQDYGPIYTTEKKWVRTRKKVGTDQIFFPCKPSVLCFPEMDPDSLFLVLGPWAAVAPEPTKKKNESGSLLLFESAV